MSFKSGITTSAFISFKAEMARHKESFDRDKALKNPAMASPNEELFRKGPKLPKSTKPVREKKKRKDGNVKNSVDSEKPPVNSDNDEDNYEQTKIILEQKAQLYEKLCQKAGRLTDDQGGNHSSEDEQINEGEGVHLVDFGRKAVLEGRNSTTDETEEQLIEYTDAFGRTRMCKPEEYAQLVREDQLVKETILDHDRGKEDQQRNYDLLSSDMERELQRQEWERQAEAELEDEYSAPADLPGPGPVYFEHLRKDEVREYGVGYYRLSTDEDVRQQQLTNLKQLHETTEKSREKSELIKEKRKTMMQERLNKIRKRKGLPVEEQTSEDPLLNNIDKELSRIRKMCESTVPPPISDKKRAKMREWDRGKMQQQQTNASISSIHKKFLRNERDDRNPDFAPPNNY